MPIPTYTPPQNTTSTSNNLTTDVTTGAGPSAGSAGLAPADVFSGTQNGSSGEVLGQDANASSGRELSREEADRLYEERIEEEYAKREGGS